MSSGTHMCQATFLTLRDYLPCKHKESGGYQCEREEAHDDGKHFFSMHTIMHAKYGNGWACESFKEPVATFAYKQHLKKKIAGLTKWLEEVDERPSVP